MSSRNERRDRCLDLDVFKTLLVTGMVFAHVVQIVQAPGDRLAEGLSNVINLISFSGRIVCAFLYNSKSPLCLSWLPQGNIHTV